MRFDFLKSPDPRNRQRAGLFGWYRARRRRM